MIRSCRLELTAVSIPGPVLRLLPYLCSARGARPVAALARAPISKPAGGERGSLAAANRLVKAVWCGYAVLADPTRKSLTPATDRRPGCDVLRTRFTPGAPFLDLTEIVLDLLSGAGRPLRVKSSTLKPGPVARAAWRCPHWRHTRSSNRKPRSSSTHRSPLHRGHPLNTIDSGLL